MAVLVLKSPNPGVLVAFLTRMGLTFVKEQHGKGPEHHACQLGDDVLEVYPGKKLMLVWHGQEPR